VTNRSGQTAKGPSEALSEEECRDRLAYTDADRYMLARKVHQEFLIKPPFTGQVYHGQAMEHWQQELDRLKPFSSPQELKRATAVYEKAMAMNPSDWNLPWKLGTLLTDGLKDHARAVEHFQKVQDLMPTFHLAYTGMGQVDLRLDRYAEAAVQFEKSLRLYEGHAPTHFLLGFAYEKQQDLAQATRHYGLAVYWQPTERMYYRELARVLRRQGKGEEAEQVAKKEALYCPSVNG
jgi:tetratricopeptide (TPR) repeat protein